MVLQRADNLMYRVKRESKNHVYYELVNDAKTDGKQNRVERRGSVRVGCNRPHRLAR